MKEQWCYILNYSQKYLISNLGNIYSVKHKKLLKQSTDNKGYMRVNLYKGKNHTVLVHRLVAQHFIPNPNKLPLVNHKDENPSNNSVDNLEWCTHTYNLNYGSCNEKMKIAKLGKKAGPHSEKTKQKIGLGNKGKIVTIEQRKNISEGHKGLIWVCNGLTRTTIKQNKLQLYLNNGYHLGMK